MKHLGQYFIMAGILGIFGVVGAIIMTALDDGGVTPPVPPQPTVNFAGSDSGVVSLDPNGAISNTGDSSIPVFEPTLPPAPTAEPAVQEHVVVAGDTMYGIALAYGVTLDELIAFNTLINPDRLALGDIVRIPSPAP